ncbi:retrovirus-related Pol polyprotein from transposon 17.6 [Trichonephila clavipes]|nr:retrovirus-related Pol polyprotein from transposon 17.6 [Trichonephila clavipes]
MPVNKGTAQFLLQEAEDGKLHPVYYMSKETNTAEEKRLCKKAELITRIARWALQLEEFDYEMEHRAGSHMKHVDALSRYPVMMPSLQKLFNDYCDEENIQHLQIATGVPRGTQVERIIELDSVLTKLSLDD